MNYFKQNDDEILWRQREYKRMQEEREEVLGKYFEELRKNPNYKIVYQEPLGYKD